MLHVCRRFTIFEETLPWFKHSFFIKFCTLPNSAQCPIDKHEIFYLTHCTSQSKCKIKKNACTVQVHYPLFQMQFICKSIHTCYIIEIKVFAYFSVLIHSFSVTNLPFYRHTPGADPGIGIFVRLSENFWQEKKGDKTEGLGCSFPTSLLQKYGINRFPDNYLHSIYFRQEMIFLYNWKPL